MHEFRHGELNVIVADTTEELARRAADDFAADAGRLLAGRDELNVYFAGAESQMAFHRALAGRTDVDWPRINALGVDEFWAPDIPPQCAVCAQPRRDLYGRVPLRSVHVPDYAAADPQAEADRYARLVQRFPPHVACLGIGQSGHLAFNEPGDTDLNDSRSVRLIDVCEASRRQLTTDPNFARLGVIPTRGITLTVPALLRAERVLVIVPLASKAEIIRRFFTSPVSPDLPATALKTRPAARLYLDAASFSLCGDLKLG